MLAQQLQRSLILNKILEILENPETCDDVQRVLTRDRGRLAALGSSVISLATSRETACSFQNIKHRVGFISNFSVIREQILDVCAAKETRLFSRLPSVFYTRTSQFTASILGIAKQFELGGADLLDQVRLLTKLKNFEIAREARFGTEVCESLYEQIKGYNDSSRKVNNIARMQDIQQDTPATASGGGGAIARTPLRSTSSSRGGGVGGGLAAPNDSDCCYRAYEHARNTLLTSIGASRSLLVGMLGHMRAGAQEKHIIAQYCSSRGDKPRFY